ncbi:hypothetical protein N5J07_02575 [Comamonas aquatica]|uniref:hypothetical protein n=1 Tax=Comamonas aquatica TaxID=225991 RepID=UPI00244B66D1|nr:hypothetical protein [Comamonas aquatica]MDH1378358.1 hypothetical protein [Comamonas aquatica]MDH1638370.1 hypothetical protein [Comamonas aquatica]
MKPRMVIGERYNWRGQPERLVYLGKNWSGNGYWHQFALIDKPDEVWCEVLDSDLDSFEETPQKPTNPKAPKPKTGLSARQERKQRKAAKRATQAAKQGEQP